MYFNLYITGSQCREFKTGIICCCFQVQVTNWAAGFCTLCRHVSTVYLGGHRGEHCHHLALMLWGHGPRICNIPCNITLDTINIMNMIITGCGYSIYLLLHHQRCIKIYFQVLCQLCWMSSIIFLLLYFVFKIINSVFSSLRLSMLALIQVLMSSQQASSFFETSNQVYKQYLRGPKTNPCGTSKFRHLPSEVLFPIVTCHNQSLKCSLIQDGALPVPPYEYSKCIWMILWSMTSKAVDGSHRISAAMYF